MTIQKPRGTYDLYKKDYACFEKIYETFNIVAKVYNFEQMITPIFEAKELFVRSIGQTTDIVTKEFYDFFDKSGRSLALRPEGTASIVRAVIENKLYATNALPLKISYFGPMFRYERPQSGRNRQFWQFGCELMGINNETEQIEMILMCRTIFQSLAITKYQLQVNYIGNVQSRQKWIDALKVYFNLHQDALSDDSIKRINKNPLRILDDKIDGLKTVVKNAPKIATFLSIQEKDEWEQFLKLLKILKINYVINDGLVRGLDYYSGVVFEYVSLSEKLQGQATLIGGGKYAGLIAELGGPDLISFGFAGGVERLMIALETENLIPNQNQLDVYLASVGSVSNGVLVIANLLRASGISCEVNYQIKKIDKHFKNASKFNPKIILIFGEKESKKDEIIVKNQKTLKETKVKLLNLVTELKKVLMTY